MPHRPDQRADDNGTPMAMKLEAAAICVMMLASAAAQVVGLIN